MKFSCRSALVALSTFSHFTYGLELNVDDEESIRNASATIAYGLMSYYKNNASDTPAVNVGLLPFPPYYWWQSGALWGGMVDYWAYTNDSSYVTTTQQALLAQVGPNHDFMVPAHRSDTGNDDQGFWLLAVMSALETQFPWPDNSSTPQLLAIAEAGFNTQAARWDTTSCGGGLKWQIFPENAGYDYKNAISNGAFLQLAARLARYTGNNTYVEWAERTWDWCQTIGLISPTYDVFDGTDDKINCTEINHIQWSYNVAMFLHGAATLYNYTNGSSVWQERTSGLIRASATFFSPFPNATDIMFEAACEPGGACNTDQFSFKAYLGRWLAKTSVLAPYAAPAIRALLRASAAAAATSCSGGGANGTTTTCGTKWYVGGWDGTAGAGQQMSALEVTQALLVANAGPPAHGAGVVISAVQPTATLALPARSAAAADVVNRSGAGAGAPSATDVAVGRIVAAIAAAAVVHR